MVRHLITFIMVVVLFIGVPHGTHAAVELDADDNGAVDIDKGGTNGSTESTARVSLGAAGLADDNTFTGSNTLGKLTNIIFSDGTETVTSDTFAFTSNWTLANFNWNIAFPAASIINATTGLLSTSAQVVNNITTRATPTTTNPYTLTAANSYNAKLHYGATGEIDLPAVADGMAIVIYNTGAFTITIDPNASEVIVRDGTVQTGGVSFTLSSGLGNFVCLVSDGVEWQTLGFKGTLAEGT